MLKNKPNSRWIISLLILLAACQPQPKIINHDPPVLSVSFDKFVEFPPSALDCDNIFAPPSLFGALIFHLKIIQWQITDFSVEKYHDKLVEIHNLIQKTGGLKIKSHRILIVAQKS